jgi:hypothetical protein
MVSGLALAVWPTLVLWSATMLRDTLGGLAVVSVWWTLGRARDLGWVGVLGTIGLSLVIVLSLRPYLGAAMLTGIAAWAAYPYIRRLHARGLVVLGAATVCAALIVAIVGGRKWDYAAHELLYRQTMTRLETLGKLYSDQPPATGDEPMRPGTAIGVTDPTSGWVLGGVVQSFPDDVTAQVAFTDDSTRLEPLADLVPLQSTTIPPLQLVAWIVPNLLGYLAGTSQTSEASNAVWVAMALVWDILLVLAAYAIVRTKMPAREWLYPLCIVAGTVLALAAVPGAPGNADRHRATQTVPLLLVLATGLLPDWERLRRASGRAVANMTTRPASEAAPASSRIRSAR